MQYTFSSPRLKQCILFISIVLLVGGEYCVEKTMRSLQESSRSLEEVSQRLQDSKTLSSLEHYTIADMPLFEKHLRPLMTQKHLKIKEYKIEHASLPQVHIQFTGDLDTDVLKAVQLLEDHESPLPYRITSLGVHRKSPAGGVQGQLTIEVLVW